MGKRNYAEVLEGVRNQFADVPAATNAQDVYMAFVEADPKRDVNPADVGKALEQLVAEGVLQRAGREGYEPTDAYMLENGHEV